jgi:hypothetical protein
VAEKKLVEYFGRGEFLGFITSNADVPGKYDFGIYKGDVERVNVARGITITLYEKSGHTGKTKKVVGPAEKSTDGWKAWGYKIERTSTSDAAKQALGGMGTKKKRALAFGGIALFVIIVLSILS